MIQVSTRYLSTLLHHSGRFEIDDCSDPSTLLILRPDGLAAMPTGLDAERRRQYVNQWGTTGWVVGAEPFEASEASLRYVIVRSFDPKTLYHFPGSRVLGKRASRQTLEEFDDGAGGPPLHWLHYDEPGPATDRVRMAGYLLVYESKPVANPYLDQL
ncbi:MAG: hypothetical protein ABFS46_09025 [Myxococcota bacterium]